MLCHDREPSTISSWMLNEMKTFERNNNCDIVCIQFQTTDGFAIFLDAFSLNCVVEVWLEERHVASVM